MENENLNQSNKLKNNASQEVSTPKPTPTQNIPTNQSKPRPIKLIAFAVLIIFIVLVIFCSGYIFAKNQLTQNPPGSPEPTAQAASPSPTTDSTANWKTYTGNDYSFKYPANSKITNEKAYSFMTTQNPTITKITGQSSNDTYSVEIYAENNYDNLSTKDFIDGYLKRLSQPSGSTTNEITGNKMMSDGTTKKVTDSLNEYKKGEINGLHALFGSDYDYDVIVMTKNDKIYTFLYNGDQGEKISEPAEKIVSQILSTLKFTDSSEDTSSTTNNGVTITVSPNHGPAGTKVNLKITGITDTNNLGLYIEDAKKGVPANGLGINSSQVNNGSYTGTYTIPSKVLTYIPRAQDRGPEGPTAKGMGKIIIYHGNDSQTFVTIPFKVE